MIPGASAGQPLTDESARTKQALRATLRHARASRRPNPDEAEALAAAALHLADSATVVAAYVSRAEEPATTALLNRLWHGGVRVLLPVLRREPDWAVYAGPGSLQPGPLGIPQPASSGTGLGAAAIAQADVVWLPGLAGTPHGDRLGAGGGWYDRALAWARPDAVRGLLLFDDEVLQNLPTDPWDEPVHALVTPGGLIRCERE